MPAVLKGSKVFASGGKRLTPSAAPAAVPWYNLTATTRDKRKRPFDENTAHSNLAIGAGAVYSPAGITIETVYGYDTFLYPNTVIWQPDETAPSLNVEYNAAEWSGADRCTDDGATLQTVRCPTSFVVAGGINNYDNNTAAFLDADGITLKQNQPFTRCTAGSYATTYVVFSDESIYGDGQSGAHGGSNIGVGVTIMPGEFTAGYIHHEMGILLRESRYYYRDAATPSNMYRWPADTCDGYALNDPITGSPPGYGGTNNQIKPGALLALSTSFNVSSLLTIPGQIIAQAAQDYGFRIVDGVGATNGIGIDTGRTPVLDVIDEFYGLYGFTFRAEPLTSGTDWADDITTIMESLYVITNDSSSNIAGGGVRRRANHSPIGN